MVALLGSSECLVGEPSKGTFSKAKDPDFRKDKAICISEEQISHL